jgi:hypothetical protein
MGEEAWPKDDHTLRDKQGAWRVGVRPSPETLNEAKMK